MNKNANIPSRKHGKRDPLVGAPGHPSSDWSPELPDSDSDSQKNVQSSIAEDLIQKLGSIFSDKTIKKWRQLLNNNSPVRTVKEHPIASAATIAASAGAFFLVREYLRNPNAVISVREAASKRMRAMAPEMPKAAAASGRKKTTGRKAAKKTKSGGKAKSKTSSASKKSKKR